MYKMAEGQSSRKNRWIYISLMVIGILLIIVGVITYLELRKRTVSDIEKKIPIRNGSESYKYWVEPPVPVYMRFWVFDLVNADAYVKHGAKPILKEKGPYTYREYRSKEEIEFLENDTLVRFKQPRSYVFVPELSNGTEGDTFTGVNFPLLTLGTLIRFYPTLLQKLLQPLLAASAEKLFMRYTVGGYLWGFEDPALKKINNFTEKLFHRKLIKHDVFGLFYGPTGNGTADGVYTVYTGQGNLTRYNKIYLWQNKSSLNFWNSPYCNMINGSDGTAWHPFITKSDTLYLFSSDVCRSLYVQYTKTETVKGIPMYRFSPPASVMQEPSKNPDNLGYCTPDCLKDGVLNVSRCRNGVPVIISEPHFYQADQSFIDAFEGLNPDAAKHATILDVEPYTGAALNADKKLQLNFYIRKLASIRETQKMQNDTVFPAIWLSESALISDSMASEFVSKVLTPIRISIILPWFLIAVGIVLFIVGLGLFLFFLISANKQKEPLIVPPPEDEHRPLLSEPQTAPAYYTAE